MTGATAVVLAAPRPCDYVNPKTFQRPAMENIWTFYSLRKETGNIDALRLPRTGLARRSPFRRSASAAAAAATTATAAVSAAASAAAHA